MAITISTVAIADGVVGMVPSGTGGVRKLHAIFATHGTGTASITVYDSNSTTITSKKQLPGMILTTANAIYCQEYFGLELSEGCTVKVFATGTTSYWVVYE